MQLRNRRSREDLRAASEVRNRTWRVSYRGVVEDGVIDAAVEEPDDEALAALEDDLDAEAGVFLVADGEDGVVGYVRVRWGATSAFASALETEIVELYVDPAHWRRGIGSALVAEALDWSPAQLDGAAVEVLAANERAQSFLTACGFERDGSDATEIGGESLPTVHYRLALG